MNVTLRRFISGIISVSLLLTASGCGKEERVPDVDAAEQTQKQTGSESTASSAETEEAKTEITQVEKTTAEETQIDEIQTYDTRVYDRILEQFYMLISDPEGDYDEVEGKMGVLEAAKTMDGKAALENIGYAIEDISGDGIPELLIGDIQGKDIPDLGTQIYTAYTISDGEPRLVFEGWYRNSYRYSGAGGFFYEGSASAASSAFGTYRLLPDGTSLSCEDFYFTDWSDESFSEIGVYHNTSGEWDKTVSEKMDITEEELWQLEEELKQHNSENVELIPFSELHSSDGTSAY